MITLILIYLLSYSQYNNNHRDLNAKAAWELGYTGKGVVVSILDDGIEKNHPDLSQNYVSIPGIHWDGADYKGPAT